MKWEYTSHTYDPRIGSTKAFFNDMGRAGWEMCGVLKFGFWRPIAIYYFKRPAEEKIP